MENNRDELMFDAPIPGMGMTHEVGGRPWQTPPQHNTVEEALEIPSNEMSHHARFVLNQL